MRGIGVGAPNGNYYTGTVEYAPNLPWKGIIPLAKLIENTNDANRAENRRVEFAITANDKMKQEAAVEAANKN